MPYGATIWLLQAHLQRAPRPMLSSEHAGGALMPSARANVSMRQKPLIKAAVFYARRTQ